MHQSLRKIKSITSLTNKEIRKFLLKAFLNKETVSVRKEFIITNQGY